MCVCVCYLHSIIFTCMWWDTDVTSDCSRLLYYFYITCQNLLYFIFYNIIFTPVNIRIFSDMSKFIFGFSSENLSWHLHIFRQGYGPATGFRKSLQDTSYIGTVYRERIWYFIRVFIEMISGFIQNILKHGYRISWMWTFAWIYWGCECNQCNLSGTAAGLTPFLLLLTGDFNCKWWHGEFRVPDSGIIILRIWHGNTTVYMYVNPLYICVKPKLPFVNR